MVKKIGSFVLLSVLLGCSSEPKLEVHQGYALGTSYSIQYQELEEKGHHSARNRFPFEVVNRSMSTYLPDSDISKINHGTAYCKSMSISKRSLIRPIYCIKHKAISIQQWVLANAYGFGPDKALKQITPAQYDSLMKLQVGEIQMTPDQRIVKDHPNIHLDFNAIAKGYTVDLLGKYLSGKGSKTT